MSRNIEHAGEEDAEQKADWLRPAFDEALEAVRGWDGASIPGLKKLADRGFLAATRYAEGAWGDDWFRRDIMDHARAEVEDALRSVGHKGHPACPDTEEMIITCDSGGRALMWRSGGHGVIIETLDEDLWAERLEAHAAGIVSDDPRLFEQL